MSGATKVLRTAANAMDTVGQLVKMTKTLPPETQKVVRGMVKENVARTKRVLNGHKLRGTSEADLTADEEDCVVRLNELLEGMSEDSTDEVPLPPQT